MAMCLLVATVSLSLISPDAPGAFKGTASLRTVVPLLTVRYNF